MSDTSAYYIAAGKSLAAILYWHEYKQTQRNAWKEFAKRFGAKDVYAISYSGGSAAVFGLKFGGTVPEGWVKKYGKFGDYWKPNHRTKSGKALIEELESLRISGPPADAGNDYLGEGRLFTPGHEKIGDQFIISQHEKAKPPPDAVPLKRSEYWAMKEAKSVA